MFKDIILISFILPLFISSCGGSYDGSGGGTHLDSRLTEIEQELAELTSSNEILEAEMIEINSQIDRLNSALDLVWVELGKRVISVIRPCDTSKEILLRLDTGEIIAYYEHGNYRYLSLIDDGTYRTTDGTNCYFKIENGELQ